MRAPTRWRFDTAPSAETLEEIAGVIRRGGVVILPTDTLYGFHADARNEAAISRIQECKARDGSKPLLVLCASSRQALELGATIDAPTTALLDAVWPAPLTAILPLARPVAASCGSTKIGIRVPALDWLRNLCELTGPIASTSVNYAGEPPVTSVEQVEERIATAMDGIADGGHLEGAPSTIIDFSTSPPTLLRAGAFGFSQDLWKKVRKSL